MKYRAVHVRLGKAVGFRVELGAVAVIAQAQRVELGDEMPADAVGADQHQRAHGIEHRAPDLLLADGDARLGGLGGDLLAGVLDLGLGGPFAGERGGQIVIGLRRPVAARPMTGPPPRWVTALSSSPSVSKNRRHASSTAFGSLA